MGESIRMLIVDDSITARMWVVTLNSNGQDALEKDDSEGFDPILLDLNMPGIDGFELGVKLRDLYPDAYLSLLTANTQVKVQERAAKLGFGFIGKPISDEKVESFIEAAEALGA